MRIKGFLPLNRRRCFEERAWCIPPVKLVTDSAGRGEVEVVQARGMGGSNRQGCVAGGWWLQPPNDPSSHTQF